MNRLSAVFSSYKSLFSTPISSWRHWGVILLVAFLAIWVPQNPPIDWELNTAGFGGDILNIYANPNYVYPPWALILLWPYYWMTAGGSHFASVLVVGWLCARRKRSLLLFAAIILNPFFLYTLIKSNIDVLVLVFPILLWEAAEHLPSSRKGLWRGLVLAILLLKPQGSLLLILYLLWRERRRWRELLLPLFIVALLVVPISLVGDPPLLLRWVDNVRNPSLQNQAFWGINNFSLTAVTPPFLALAILALLALALYAAMRWRRRSWSHDHTLAAILLLSMFISPYTSNQSFTAALAFVPSWALVGLEFSILGIIDFFGDYWDHNALWALIFAILALFLYAPPKGQTDAN